MPERAPEPDADDPSVGSVEEEAHKLVRAAASWFGAAGSAAGPDGAEAGSGPAGEESAGDGAEQGQGPGQDHEQELCTGCPWCRAKAAAGPIGADTLDSLADLLASAAVSLRHFADSRRAGHEADEDADTPSQEDGS